MNRAFLVVGACRSPEGYVDKRLVYLVNACNSRSIAIFSSAVHFKGELDLDISCKRCSMHRQAVQTSKQCQLASGEENSDQGEPSQCMHLHL